ncbi:MAG: WYL domain-containing protein [Spirochaetaceae bacterium]
MSKNYEGVAERFAIILNELNISEKVHINRLVEVTGSDIRNIQMDLNQRLKDPFKIETDRKGNYWLDKKYQGLYTSEELKEFAKIAGISEIFPEFDSNFLRSIIDKNITNSFLIRPQYKDRIYDNHNFKLLVDAIDNRCNIYFSYITKKRKTYDVSPYKLVNMYGHWYLCGTHNGILKTYKFSKLENIHKNNNKFDFKESVLNEIEKSDTIWISNRDDRQNKNIKIRTKPEFTQYFKENITIPGEINRSDEEDGSLIITLEANVSYEILSIIKCWIPRIEIVEPTELKVELKEQLTEYLNELN